MTYRLAEVGVTRIADDLHITRDMPEWGEYREFLRAGGVPEEMEPIVPQRWASLEQAKADAWAITRLRRDEIEASGFDFMGKTLDSDTRAVQRINTAVQAAQAALTIGEAFAIRWTCMDGKGIDLDAIGMIGMPVALAMHANALHVTARAFRDRIDAAQDVAEIEGIVNEVEAWGGG
jgi:hypothetical protein